MIYSEDCYVVLDEENKIATDYIELVFESVEEAETFIEKQGDDVEMFTVSSFLEFIENMSNQ